MSAPETATREEVRGFALVVLRREKEKGNGWLRAAWISRLLSEQDGVALHWKTILAALKKSSGAVERRKRNGSWEFRILKAGEDLIDGNNSSVTLVDPEQAVRSVVSLHACLSQLSGTIRICDPYLDHATIEHLDACPRGSRIRLLTRNVYESGRLRRVYAALAQNTPIEVRICSQNVLHDRYVISDAEMMILGTSLNSVGKKHCFVIRAGPDIQASMVTVFDRLWTVALVWP